MNTSLQAIGKLIASWSSDDSHSPVRLRIHTKSHFAACSTCTTKRVETPPFILDKANLLHADSEYPFSPPRKSSFPSVANLCLHGGIFALFKCKGWRSRGLFDFFLWCSYLLLTLRNVRKFDHGDGI